MNKCAFEARVLEILRENGASRWRRHMDEGRLDPRSLHKYRTSSDIFRKKEIPGKKEYAVAFVLDASGSMRGAPERAAQLMALQFADSMHMLNIPFCIAAFGDRGVIIHRAGSTYSRPELREKLSLLYSSRILVKRYGKMHDVRYVNFNSEKGIRNCRLWDNKNDQDYYNTGGSTYPWTSLVGALEEILPFPGGKILVTMSDGGINGAFHKAPESYFGAAGNGIQKEVMKMHSKTVWPENSSPEYYGYDYGFIQLGKWMRDNGVRPLYMDLMSTELTKIAGRFPNHIRPKDTFRVDNLAQGYDALVSKLSTEFNFDYDKKLR